MQINIVSITCLTAIAFYSLDVHSQECSVIEKAGYIIDKPGTYCFESDIFTRVDFADHPAERALVEIRSSDVTVDMRGHRGGRARLPLQNGGAGISIVNAAFANKKYQNIVIKNGTLSDFNSGIFYFYTARSSDYQRKEVEKIGEDDYFYRSSNVRITNVQFRNCKDNFKVIDVF